MPFEARVPTRFRSGHVTRRNVYLRSLERGRKSPGMSHGLCKDGSTFPAELSLRKAVHGGQSVFLRVVRDMSERKELEVGLLEAIGREQRRLGDDLHDGLGQELTGVSLLLSAFVNSTRHGKRATTHRCSERSSTSRALTMPGHAPSVSPAGRMKDTNPNDAHSTLRCSV